MARSTAPEARPWVPDEPTLETLREALPACQGCELLRGRRPGVLGEGDPDARLVLLGEQPGDRRTAQGRPFVGPAGRVLVDALRRRRGRARRRLRHQRGEALQVAGRSAASDGSTSRPGRRHVEACRPWLDAELSLAAPGRRRAAGRHGRQGAPRVDLPRGRGSRAPADWPETLPGRRRRPAGCWPRPTPRPCCEPRATGRACTTAWSATCPGRIAAR